MEMQLQIEIESPRQTKAPVNPMTEYSELLEYLGVPFTHTECYLQVGEIKKVQGWILHLSTVMSQVTELLQKIVPFLISHQVPFKIVMSLVTAEDMLIGSLGVAQIGKIVSIYPDDDIKALDLAKKLVDLTRTFKGPSIPTDLCLGSIVYTRYGSFNPVIRPNEKGGDEKFIYDSTGQLIQDAYSIPFELPSSVSWPFHSLVAPTLPKPSQFLNRTYKILDVLKIDCRGHVFLGLYLKGLLSVKKCVLKQGFTHADSDIAGRDIRDKLAWQVELYRELHDTIPMPELYDFIQEETYSLLAMKYINSTSLYHKVQDLNPFCKAWADLPRSESAKFLNYGLELTRMISCIHKKGYVHRDIMPVNFLIDKKNRMFAIDLELAYSLEQQKPSPPFKLGTPGFASPEQLQMLPPKIDQDIYSLGATLLWLFTGLTPIKFNPEDTTALYTNLVYFIQSQDLASIVARCLSTAPQGRPSIETVLLVLEKYQQEPNKHKKAQPSSLTSQSNAQDLHTLIADALVGLNKPPVVSSNDFWYSKKTTIQNYTAPKNKEYTRYPGITEGMAGPIYLLARLGRLGINIGSCMPRLTKALNYVEQHYLNRIPDLSPGLYFGSAGLAVALKECIESGLFKAQNSTYREYVKRCLEQPNEKLDIASGIAGQGLAILQCCSILPEQDSHRLLHQIIDRLVSHVDQQKSFSQHQQNLDLAQGDIGILWFLLEYLSFNPDNSIQNVVERKLDAILGSIQSFKSNYNTIASRESFDQPDGGSGFILLYLKAYEVLMNDKYKQTAKKPLLKYESHIVHTNFSQKNGLAGLGEVLLEASRVLQEEHWRQLADWIAGLFQHTFYRNEDSSGYWVLEEQNPPTADFMSGISGIIHFLGRCIYPDKIGYRLLK